MAVYLQVSQTWFIKLSISDEYSSNNFEPISTAGV